MWLQALASGFGPELGPRCAPAHLDVEESVAPVEDHGFTLVDFLPDRIVLQQFKWDVDRESVNAIDRLEPFYRTELPRPG